MAMLSKVRSVAAFAAAGASLSNGTICRMRARSAPQFFCDGDHGLHYDRGTRDGLPCQQVSAFDALCQRHLALPRQQADGAHLTQVGPDRVLRVVRSREAIRAPAAARAIRAKSSASSFGSAPARTLVASSSPDIRLLSNRLNATVVSLSPFSAAPFQTKHVIACNAGVPRAPYLTPTRKVPRYPSTYNRLR